MYYIFRLFICLDIKTTTKLCSKNYLRVELRRTKEKRGKKKETCLCVTEKNVAGGQKTGESPAWHHGRLQETGGETQRLLRQNCKPIRFRLNQRHV